MSLDLEDFSTPSAPEAATPQVDLQQAVETTRAAAYEDGYSAGWDDATNTHAQEQAKIGAEFARHLQELSFTFHEARAHVIEAVRPLLAEISTTFLPKVMDDAFGAHLLEILEPLVASAADQPVQLAVAPGTEAALTEFLDAGGHVAIEITEDDTLATGQAFLKLGQVERKIDLSQALSQFQDALRSLGDLNERIIKNA